MCFGNMGNWLLLQFDSPPRNSHSANLPFHTGAPIHYNGRFMLVFRIHRMKDLPRGQFRWAPHVSGAANVKPKDYEPSDEVSAENEYAAWALLRTSESPLGVGDLLELPAGQLRICKYVGFEEARWILPEVPAGVLNSVPPGTADVSQAVQV
jgi:hypothetical protein